jgi:hypothetical protein
MVYVTGRCSSDSLFVSLVGARPVLEAVSLGVPFQAKPGLAPVPINIAVSNYSIEQKFGCSFFERYDHFRGYGVPVEPTIFSKTTFTPRIEDRAGRANPQILILGFPWCFTVKPLKFGSVLSRESNRLADIYKFKVQERLFSVTRIAEKEIEVFEAEPRERYVRAAAENGPLNPKRLKKSGDDKAKCQQRERAVEISLKSGETILSRYVRSFISFALSQLFMFGGDVLTDKDSEILGSCVIALGVLLRGLSRFSVVMCI